MSNSSSDYIVYVDYSSGSSASKCFNEATVQPNNLANIMKDFIVVFDTNAGPEQNVGLNEVVISFEK